MRTLRWNKKAKSDYHRIIDYILFNWGEASAQNFIDLVDKFESILETGNVDFETTIRKDIRRCVLSKQVTLFYKTYNDGTVELLRFWNNYQDISSINL
jgi:plasmid stabilization system protein ParE